MSDIAIRVEHLGKQYSIGKRERYKSLRDSLTYAFVAPFRRIAERALSSNGSQQQSDDRIWALKDVSFEVKRGEAVGIIGGNGAGKSTLLKILSRITEPTEGLVEIKGRVGSLLEVGTGFHPELTGRENIYLNGAVLGMKKAEIDHKFDEIVAFAGIEKFIDTPVKHYSSGMYVRLAFAVAAHLEPEILFVDEVLAVGDALFQKKCLGKMEGMAKRGRTVLFVSHNMAAVSSLCQRGILLNNGNLEKDDLVHNTVTSYLALVEEFVTPVNGAVSLVDHPGRIKKQDGIVRLKSCRLLSRIQQPVAQFASGEEARIAIGYELASPILSASSVEFSITVSDFQNRRLFTCLKDVAKEKLVGEDLVGEIQCVLPRLPLIPSVYSISIGVNVSGVPADSVYGAVKLNVVSGDWFQNSRQPIEAWGSCLVDHYWSVSPAENSHR